eukprot:8583943-Alexandrium_andersonii.AAC.1
MGALLARRIAAGEPSYTTRGVGGLAHGQGAPMPRRITTGSARMAAEVPSCTTPDVGARRANKCW